MQEDTWNITQRSSPSSYAALCRAGTAVKSSFAGMFHPSFETWTFCPQPWRQKLAVSKACSAVALCHTLGRRSRGPSQWQNTTAGFLQDQGQVGISDSKEGAAKWKIRHLLPPCVHSVINVGSRTGEYRLSLEAFINATLMAHVKSEAPAQEQPESACWGLQDPTCLPGSKSQAQANAQERPEWQQLMSSRPLLKSNVDNYVISN